VFVNPALLTVRAAATRELLPSPQPGFTLIDGITAVVSGTAGQDSDYYVRNDATIDYGMGRLRASFSQSSDSGLLGEVLAAELDRPGLRYTAGSFWIPGNELLGRRRILGAGVGSQFDTRRDRDHFEGSPLTAFLD
jgi:Mat/Ecp fimbriae outer membrane usher protein